MKTGNEISSPVQGNGDRDQITIRALQKEDVSAAVEVHLTAFPSFFLSFLGPRFLRQLYSSFAGDDQCVSLALFRSGVGLIGVIAGPLEPEGYFSRLLKRRWFAFALASMGALARKPSIFLRLLRAIFYRGDNFSTGSRILLSTLAVHPAHQGAGAGRMLLTAWLDEANRRGAHGAYLTTDADNNESVNRFYRKLGWRVGQTFHTPEGRRMHRYVVDFKSRTE